MSSFQRDINRFGDPPIVEEANEALNDSDLVTTSATTASKISNPSSVKTLLEGEKVDETTISSSTRYGGREQATKSVEELQKETKENDRRKRLFPKLIQEQPTSHIPNVDTATPLDWKTVKTVRNDRFIEQKKLPSIIGDEKKIPQQHPEARRRLQMLGLLPTDEDKNSAQNEHRPLTTQELEEQSDLVSVMMKKTMGNITVEDPEAQAHKYMIKHEIYELFKTITTKMILHQPPDPAKFMLEDLETLCDDYQVKTHNVLST
ncbi:unnamed protein product [Didymodactylos carnosus]|uniref:Uncharacterized protein n=1 Tax=Didymodactylos carnosus TaxID=1234261 RepID=A0A8S2FBL6_9BILA|nr:unnamed protein product [Didymodactylos carnosus]CAF4217123.1 unnamed protein product [Didymodactylos carnosus]